MGESFCDQGGPEAALGCKCGDLGGDFPPYRGRGELRSRRAVAAFFSFSFWRVEDGIRVGGKGKVRQLRGCAGAATPPRNWALAVGERPVSPPMGGVGGAPCRPAAKLPD